MDKLYLLPHMLILSGICFSPSAFAQTSIQCGQVINGSIDAANEEDRYTFNAAAGDVIILQIAATTRDFTPRMELLNPSNQSQASNTSQITATLTQAGAYTVAVRRISGSSQTGGYQLFLQRPKNPCNPTPLTECQTVRATLRDPIELDAYTFNGAVGQTVTLRLVGSSLEFSPTMRLYDPDGISLTSGSTITRTLTKSGTHTVLISANPAGNTGSYAVSFGNIKVELSSLNGGEVFLAGTPVTIKWSSEARNPSRASHEIQLSTDGGATFPNVIAAGLSATAQSFIWSIPPSLTVSNGRIRVVARDTAGNVCGDTSDTDFAVANFNTAETTTHEYDSLNRLTRTIYTDGTAITYTYDDVGNRLAEVVSSVPVFRVTGSPVSLSVPQRSNATSIITVTSLNGFNSEADLACVGLPQNVSCRFSRSGVTPPANGTATSTLTVTVDSDAQVGMYGFQVVGTSGTLTRTLDMNLTVAAALDFTITSNTSSLSAMPGSIANAAVTVTSLNGFSGAVNLSCTSLVSGVTCNFNPAQVVLSANGTIISTLTVSVAPNVTPRTDLFQVRGVGGGLTRTSGITLDVLPVGETLLLNENFSGGIPQTWSIVDGGEGGGEAATWTTTNPGERTIGTPFSTPFAIVDSKEAGSGAIQDEQLITPTINAAGCSRVVLDFSNQFRWQTGNQDEMADVDVSIDGGSTWTNVLRMQGANDGYTLENTKSLDITSVIAANPVNVKVRFRFHNGSDEWWWAIDNVKIRCTSATTPVSPGDVLISEFRLRGANGANDEFIELYNNTDSLITVSTTDGSSGWTIAARNTDGTATARFTIPSGVRIPARDHYLIVNGSLANGYSLAAYASEDAAYFTDVADDTGIALFRTAAPANFTIANRLDAVGFSGLTGAVADLYREGAGLASVGSSDGQYSFVRRMIGGRLQDTNNNAADFVLVSPTGANFNGVQSTPGAPGPQNLNSPISLILPIIRPTLNTTSAIRNRSRPGKLTTVDKIGQGIVVLRFTYTNTTGSPVATLRFRIVELVTQGATASQLPADVRVLSSEDVTLIINNQQVTARGLTLEQPPDQPSGGGLNSSLRVDAISASTPLTPGATLTGAVRLNVVRGGRVRISLVPETSPED